MRGVIVVAVALMALAGCKSTAERNAEADAYCQSLGAPIGSNAYVQCRLVQQARNDARKEAAIRDMQRGLGQVSSNLMNQSRPVNCTSRRTFGDTVETTCN